METATMKTFGGVDISFKGAENEMMDNVITHTAVTRDGGAEFTFTMHSLPKLKLARIGRFHEVEFVQAKNMPRSFLEQASAWNYALGEVSRQFKNVGWLAMAMSHDSDLMDIALHHGFIPTVDDTGVQMIIKYLPMPVESKDRDKFITSASKQVIECACFFGPIQLQGGTIPLELGNCGQGKLNPGLRVLARRYAQMPLYGISVVVEADADTAPAPFIPYIALTRLLQHVTRTDFETRLVGVVAHNRYECLACLEAGFFPLVSEVENEGIFIRYF